MIIHLCYRVRIEHRYPKVVTVGVGGLVGDLFVVGVSVVQQLETHGGTGNTVAQQEVRR